MHDGHDDPANSFDLGDVSAEDAVIEVINGRRIRRRRREGSMKVQLDAHVHVHPQADVERLSDLALAVGSALVLAVVETSRGGEFERLRSHPRWVDAGETGSLRLGDSSPTAPVCAIYGRQLVSSDRLEVLAIGLPPHDEIAGIGDGAHSTAALVDRVLDSGAVAALPWGVGKWWGRRGDVVRRIAGDDRYRRHPRFFLGDIAARCRAVPVPLPFRAPIRILAGSDPLPLRGSEEQLAIYRTEIEAPLDPARPRSALVAALGDGAAVLPRGSMIPWRREARDQLRLLASRRGRRPS